MDAWNLDLKPKKVKNRCASVEKKDLAVFCKTGKPPSLFGIRIFNLLFLIGLYMVQAFLFFAVWWAAIKRGAIVGKWRWLSMLAFLLAFFSFSDYLVFFGGLWFLGPSFVAKMAIWDWFH